MKQSCGYWCCCCWSSPPRAHISFGKKFLHDDVDRRQEETFHERVARTGFGYDRNARFAQRGDVAITVRKLTSKCRAISSPVTTRFDCSSNATANSRSMLFMFVTLSQIDLAKEIRE